MQPLQTLLLCIFPIPCTTRCLKHIVFRLCPKAINCNCQTSQQQPCIAETFLNVRYFLGSLSMYRSNTFTILPSAVNSFLRTNRTNLLQQCFSLIQILDGFETKMYHYRFIYRNIHRFHLRKHLIGNHLSTPNSTF